MPRFVAEIRDGGFAGVQNFPTVGLIDGTFRAGLEETDMGYGLEVEMIGEAACQGLLTAAYVFEPSQAAAMADAGADVLVAHMGLTTQGAIGARSAPSLGECVERVQAIRDAAPEPIVLCHGGPLAEPADVRHVLERTRGVAGFFGASAVERLPVETAISQTVTDFKNDHR